MAPLLDDDEEVATAEQEANAAKTVVDEMFDDLETVAAAEELGDETRKPTREDQ